MRKNNVYLYGFILLFVIVNLVFVISSVNGNSKNLIKLDFSSLDNNLGIMANNDEIIFDDFVVENQKFLKTDLFFNEKIDFENLKEYRILMNFKTEEINSNSKLNFLLGFTNINEIIKGNGFFEFTIKDKELIFYNYGKDMNFEKRYKIEKLDLEVEYYINKDVIELKLKINNDEFTKLGKLEKTFNPNNFWFGINEIKNTKLKLSNFKIE